MSAVPVVLTPRPFAGAVEMTQPAGRTMAAVLLEAVREDRVRWQDLNRAALFVDGVEIDRAEAMDHVLREGQVVNVVVRAHGGGGGGRKDVGQILLQIAVIAVSAWVGGAPAVASLLGSQMAARVAAAAVMVIGNMAVQSLFKPESTGGKANDIYALQSTSNRYRPWEAMPMALGEVVVAPDMAVKSFTRTRGDDVWIHGILGLHYGRCVTGDHKIGDTLISSMSAEDVEIVEHLTPGPRTFSLYPNDTDQLDLQEELEATTGSATPVVRAASSDGERFEFDFYLPRGLYFAKDDGRKLAASVTLTIRYRAIDAEGEPTGDWTAGLTVPLTATNSDPWRITRSLSLPLGRYEFEVTRSILEDDNEKRHDDVAWTAVRAIAFRKPITDETLSVIEFAVRATALNQGALAPITCRITPVVETWTGTEWGEPEPSSNPAALTRWLMTGPAPAKPLTSEQADAGLRTWSALCDEYDWSAHLYVTDDRTQAETLALLEPAGRASVFWDGSQLVASPWVEKPVPRQLFSGVNLRQHRWTITYPDPVHALRVEYQNLDQGGEADELYVYADGYGETDGPGVTAATLIEALRLEGQRTPGRAFRDGRWELGRRKLQRRVDTWQADVEAVACRLGDRVRLSWQRAAGEGGARIRTRRWSGGLVSGLRLDRPVEFLPGDDYCVDLRLVDEVLTGVPVVNPAVDGPVRTREIAFATPREAEVTPARGDLIAFGVAERVSEDVEIVDITPGEGLTASLTGVRYVAPQLMAGETGPIPDLPNRLSRDRAKDPPAPSLLGVTALAGGVKIGFAMPPWRGSPVTGFACRWRPTPQPGQPAGWSALPELGAGAMLLTTPPLLEAPFDTANVTRIDVQITAMTAAGQASAPLSVTVEVAGPSRPAATDWSLTPRPGDASGVQQPGLILTRTGASPAEPLLLVETALYDAGVGDADRDWRTAYDGPMVAALPLDGLSAGAVVVVALTYRSEQRLPGERRVLGPVMVPGLVAGDAVRIGGRDAVETLEALAASVFTLTQWSSDTHRWIEAIAWIEGEALGTYAQRRTTELYDGLTAAVDDISLIGARTEDGEGWLLNADTVFVSPTETLVESLTALHLEVDGAEASITELMTLTGDLETGLAAVVSVALDVNGHVVGWRAENDGSTGSFLVVADEFGFVDPDGGSPVYPLAYGLDNILRLQNVLIDNAEIIGDLIVNRRSIVDFAVSTKAVQWVAGAVTLSGTTPAAVIQVSKETTGKRVELQFDYYADFRVGGGSFEMTERIVRYHNAIGSTPAPGTYVTIHERVTPSPPISGDDYIIGKQHIAFDDQPPAGTYTYILQVFFNQTGWTSQVATHRRASAEEMAK